MKTLSNIVFAGILLAATITFANAGENPKCNKSCKKSCKTECKTCSTDNKCTAEKGCCTKQKDKSCCKTKSE